MGWASTECQRALAEPVAVCCFLARFRVAVQKKLGDQKRSNPAERNHEGVPVAGDVAWKWIRYHAVVTCCDQTTFAPFRFVLNSNFVARGSLCGCHATR